MSSEGYNVDEDEYFYDDNLSRTSSVSSVAISRTSTNQSNAAIAAQSNNSGIKLIFRTFGNASNTTAISTGEDTYSYDVFAT